MNLEEINGKVDKLGNAWENFKQLNDQRLAEIEKKGAADPLIMDQLSKLNAFMDGQKSSIETINADIEAVKAAAARGFKGGDTKDADGETPEMKAYRAGLDTYLRKGADDGLEALHKKAMSVNSDPDGGYLVTPQMSSTIIKIVTESTPMRALASVETISTDSLEFFEDRGTITAQWTGETEAPTETATPKLGKHNIPTHEMSMEPRATRKLLEDASINIEQWLADKAAQGFALGEATAFISGNGVGKPRGILTYAAGTGWGQIEQINSGDNGAILPDSILKLVYGVKEAYSAGSSFLMNRASVLAVRLLKEATTNQYLWQPGLQAGEPDRLVSYPVYQGSDMPAITQNALPVAFGNFKKAYQIVDRRGILLIRDELTAKPFIKFYMTKRVGGDVVNYEALKLLKIST